MLLCGHHQTDALSGTQCLTRLPPRRRFTTTAASSTRDSPFSASSRSTKGRIGCACRHLYPQAGSPPRRSHPSPTLPNPPKRFSHAPDASSAPYTLIRTGSSQAAAGFGPAAGPIAINTTRVAAAGSRAGVRWLFRVRRFHGPRRRAHVSPPQARPL